MKKALFLLAIFAVITSNVEAKRGFHFGGGKSFHFHPNNQKAAFHFQKGSKMIKAN